MNRPPSPTRPIRFLLGGVQLTPAALEALIRNQADLLSLIRRHQSGDYGELCFHDRQVNEQQIRHRGRVLSSYPLPDETVLWVITETGWQRTTVLTRDEY